MSGIFKFKQFNVDQSGCAMKINTDGVLLAATVRSLSATHILDIGTGTGVIALMLAQRFPEALVDAVEIDESAAQTAERNFKNSAFASRIKAYCSDIIYYETGIKYNLVVSNPPYFVNDLKNSEKRKQIARHAGDSFFESFLKKVSGLLTEDGCLWMILPVKQSEMVIKFAGQYGLSLSEQINICSDENKPIIRHIICLKRFEGKFPEIKDFYIYQSEKVYTDAYSLLLKDFFLAF